jgi:NTE family protein
MDSPKSVYGLDPDKMPVADAVRASMSIPFFFRPVTLTNATTKVTSMLVDGGVLSNLPIDSLDWTDGRQPRRPTFGVTVMPNLPAGDDKVVPLPGLPLPGGLHLLEGVIATMLVGRDQAYLTLGQCTHHCRRLDPGWRRGLRDHRCRNRGVVSERLPGHEGLPADVELAGIRPALSPRKRCARITTDALNEVRVLCTSLMGGRRHVRG